MKITGRTSTLTHAFITSIIPHIEPTEDQIIESLEILGMSLSDIRCAYCWDKPTEWDHLLPLVENKFPTGYISEIHNLVPACGKCNQSKGNKYWKKWILSDAPLSPKSKKVSGIEGIISRLDKYEEWGSVTRINLEELVGQELWNNHWNNREKLFELMAESQILADKIKQIISKNH
ncbi:MAG: HNH endonuclease [Planctomycetes bacterium]|nr:HNH endonuclease [Planctomycetota bacterium]